jgi:sugar lactone lactonase YvrE
MKINNKKSIYISLRKFIFISLLFFVYSTVNAQALADIGACYASTGHNDGGRLFKIDPETGQGTLIGSSGLNALPGLAINSVGEIYATTPPEGDIYRIDADSGSAVFVIQGNGRPVSGIAFDSNDILYATQETGLYTVDFDTGFTKIGHIGLNLNGIAINPLDDTIWLTTWDEIYTFDPATDQTTLIGRSNLSPLTDLAFDSKGNLFATQGGGFETENYLLSINTINGESSVIGEIGFQSVSGLAFFREPSTIFVSPDNIDLGLIEVDSSSSVNVTFGNAGNKDLTITEISEPGAPFVFSNLPDLPTILVPDNSITFVATFMPADTGIFNASSSIISNDELNPEYEFILSAKGFTIHTADSGTCYATIDRYNDKGLLRINTETGAGTLIGETQMPLLAINSSGEIFGKGFDHRIYQIDALTGGKRFVVDPGLTGINSMAFDKNDLLYVLAARRLYTLDLSSGITNEIGIVGTGIGGNDLKGLAIDPITNILWATDEFYLYHIDPLTAKISFFGYTELHSINGLAFDVAGNLYATQMATNLLTINKSDSKASLIGDIGFWPVNDLSFFNVPVTGRHLSVTSTNIDFGSIDVGGHKSIPVTMGNYGTEELIVGDISFPEDPFYNNQHPSLPVTIPAFTSKNFILDFAPTDTGLFNSSIIITSNDDNNLSLEVLLKGEGINLKATEAGALYAAMGTSYYGSGALFQIDTVTGEGTEIGPIRVGAMSALAINSVGTLYGASKQGFIYKLDVNSKSVLFASNINIILKGMAFNNKDVLYGTDGEDLYIIDQEKGFQNIGSTGTSLSGLTFDPIDGTLWGSNSDSVYTIDTLNGTTTLVGNTQYSDITGLSFDAQGNLYAVQQVPYSTLNRLISIKKSNGEGTLIGNIGAYWLIESLAFNQMKDVSDLFDTMNNIPKVFALEQNYPNPFNSYTNIRYDLPVASEVELVVYDILGKKVATLVNSYQRAGKHSVKWDASSLSSGLYFYQMNASPFLRIKKSILIK